MKRNTDHLTWVITKLPVASAVALDRFTTINPHWKGAHWDDCLDTLLDADAWLDVTEPMYEDEELAAYGHLTAAVAITLLYSAQSFTEANSSDQCKQVLHTIRSLGEPS